VPESLIRIPTDKEVERLKELTILKDVKLLGKHPLMFTAGDELKDTNPVVVFTVTPVPATEVGTIDTSPVGVISKTQTAPV
jgi:hypothetical protein